MRMSGQGSEVNSIVGPGSVKQQFAGRRLIMRIRITFAALSILLLTGGNVWAAPAFSSLYTFGDSLSDAGDSPSAVMSIYKILNNNCDPLHFCPPYDDGRLSNGPVASEYLAESLFPGAVTTTNFRSYAVGGATSGIGNSGDIGGSATDKGDLGLPGMKQEVDRYISDSGGSADPNGLYLVWGGANDYLTHDSPVSAAQNIGGYVNMLAAAGARHILVPNLPDLGHTPLARAEGMEAEARDYTIVFNNELATQLGNTGSSFPTTDIFRFDTYSFVNNIIQNPGDYMLPNVTGPCISLPFDVSCGNPDGHLYWDDVHPTTRAHAILGGAFASAVPEPRVAVLFIGGLFVLGMAVYRRRTLM